MTEDRSLAAGWKPDPTGRFDRRFWDGLAWTERVERGGVTFTDPPVMPALPRVQARFSARQVRRRRITARLVVIGLLGSVAAVIAYVHLTGPSIHGSITLQPGHFISHGSQCSGSGRYRDLHEGATAWLADESGSVMDSGSLRPGSIDARGRCVFTFAVTATQDVPTYVVSVAHRYSRTLQRSRLEATSWTVRLRADG